MLHLYVQGFFFFFVTVFVTSYMENLFVPFYSELSELTVHWERVFKPEITICNTPNIAHYSAICLFIFILTGHHRAVGT